MIDTLILYFPIKLPAIEESPYWMCNQGTQFLLPRYENFTIANKNLPTTLKGKYIPESQHSKQPLLQIEIGSVPKLIFGNNCDMAMDIAVICKVINKYVNEIQGLEDLYAAEGLINRVDFCWNFQVGELVTDYLQALSKTTCTSRNISSFTNRRQLPHGLDIKEKGSTINGVLMDSKSTSASFYDKYKESLNEKAKGVLRFEKRIWGNSLIGKQIGIPHPRLKDLTPEIAMDVLKRELEFLGISGEFISRQDILSQLIEMHGPRKGRKFNSYLNVINKYPGKNAKELSECLGVSLGTVYKWKKELRENDISLGLSPSTTRLPKLTSLFTTEIQINRKKFLSDTGEAITPFTEQELVGLETKLNTMRNQKSSEKPRKKVVDFDQVIVVIPMVTNVSTDNMMFQTRPERFITSLEEFYLSAQPVDLVGSMKFTIQKQIDPLADKLFDTNSLSILNTSESLSGQIKDWCVAGPLELREEFLEIPVTEKSDLFKYGLTPVFEDSKIVGYVGELHPISIERGNIWESALNLIDPIEYILAREEVVRKA